MKATAASLSSSSVIVNALDEDSLVSDSEVASLSGTTGVSAGGVSGFSTFPLSGSGDGACGVTSAVGAGEGSSEGAGVGVAAVPVASVFAAGVGVAILSVSLVSVISL